MWKFFLSDKNGTPLSVRLGLKDTPTLMVDSLRVLAAHWASPSITTATTTPVVNAKSSQSIMLTDLIIVLSKKVASATIIVRLSDGTNTENLLTFDAATDSFSFSHAFQGGIRGWKDANLEIVTSHDTTLTVLAGYVHISKKATKTYNIWNAER